MPKITVDVSQIQPAQGIPAQQVHRLPRMARVPGDAKAADSVRQVDAEQKRIVAGIARPTIPGVVDLRVPGSSEYVAPPVRVVAASDRLEPSA